VLLLTQLFGCRKDALAFGVGAREHRMVRGHHLCVSANDRNSRGRFQIAKGSLEFTDLYAALGRWAAQHLVNASMSVMNVERRNAQMNPARVESSRVELRHQG